MTVRYDEACVQDATQTSADGAVSILPTTRTLLLSTTGAGTNAITFASMISGQRVNIYMTAQSTGTYEGTVTGGTLTFNAANEAAQIVNIGGTIYVEALNGATVV